MQATEDGIRATSRDATGQLLAEALSTGLQNARTHLEAEQHVAAAIRELGLIPEVDASTVLPTPARLVRPTDGSITSAAARRPPPSATTATPTARASTPVTTPSCSA